MPKVGLWFGLRLKADLNLPSKTPVHCMQGYEEMMKVLSNTGWRAFSSVCIEVAHFQVHRGWRMEAVC